MKKAGTALLYFSAVLAPIFVSVSHLQAEDSVQAKVRVYGSVIYNIDVTLVSKVVDPIYCEAAVSVLDTVTSQGGSIGYRSGNAVTAKTIDATHVRCTVTVQYDYKIDRFKVKPNLSLYSNAFSQNQKTRNGPGAIQESVFGNSVLPVNGTVTTVEHKIIL